MKQTAQIFLVCAGLLFAGCATAQTTFTNGIKASQLGTAATFNGTENLFMWQVVSSTNRTAWATLNQVLAPAIAQDNATSNGLMEALSAEAATRSNNDASTLAAANYTSANFTMTEHDILSNTITAMNSAWSVDIAGVRNFDYSLSNSVNAVSNNVNALAASTLAMGAGLSNSLNNISSGIIPTNNGNAVFTSVRTPAVNLGSFAFAASAATTTNLNLSAGCYQLASLLPGNSASEILFSPTNLADGQNVTLMLYASAATYVGTTKASAGYRLVALAGSADNYSTPGAFVIREGTSGNWLALQWQVFGTNIVFSAGAQ